MIIRRASPDDKDAIWEMLQPYLRERTAITQNTEPVVIDYPYFDAYWKENDRYPFIITNNFEAAGFAFVRNTGEQEWSIAEFYILPDCRRQGIGIQAAIELFNYFHGAWKIRYDAHNETARLFWEAVKSRYGRTIDLSPWDI